MKNSELLHRLSETMSSRRNADPETSYVARLMAGGPDAILRKIGEECTELILAGKGDNRQNVVMESSDVLFHVMVLLAYNDLSIEDVLEELRRREGTSGIEEKRARGTAKQNLNQN